jgi:alpha-aminoadipic semialdehyde synthase
MVTASYISNEMAALHDEARNANVRILNEIGLDPGLDHMTAMQIIDDVHEQGGKIVSFESYCGGLPAPEHSNNPLGYKFSWSPRGALLAAMNPARFKAAGQVHEIHAGGVMQAATPIYTYKGLALEGYPNRDAIQYEKLYKLEKDPLLDMFRGTLRYRGYSELMAGFQALGLLDTSEARMEDFRTVNHWVT